MARASTARSARAGRTSTRRGGTGGTGSGRATADALDDSATAAVNEVRLRGRLAGPSAERDLPSGDVVAGFSLIVDRAPDPRRRAGRVRVDTVECTAFGADLRRRVARFAAGDVVEVTGRIERGFSRGPAGITSRYRVVVATASRVARAPATERATMAG